MNLKFIILYFLIIFLAGSWNTISAQDLSEENQNPNLDKLKSIFDDEEIFQLTVPDKVAKPQKTPKPKLEPEPEPQQEPKPETNQPALPEPEKVDIVTEPVETPKPEIDTKSPEEITETPPPSENSEQPETPTPPETTEPSVAPKSPNKLMRGSRQFESSFGSSEYSIFFSPKDFANYLNIVRRVEEEVFLNGTLAGNLEEIIDIDDQLIDDDIAENEEIEQEPIVFPYFHLISIIYHTPNKWAAIINGLTITSDNNDPTKELYIRSINSKVAQIIWKPQDYRLYEATLNNQQTPDHHQNNEHYKTVEHRKIKLKQRLIFDDELRTIAFSLQPNQLFFSEYVNIYEGNPKQILPPPPTLPIDGAIEENEDKTIIPIDPNILDSEKKSPTEELDNPNKRGFSPNAVNESNDHLRENIKRLAP